MSTSSLQSSIDYWNRKSFNEYKEYLEKEIQLNKETAIFLYQHIENFLSKYQSSLGQDAFAFLEPQFYLAMELKNYQKARDIMNVIYKEYKGEMKVFRMLSEKNELDPKGDVDVSVKKYKELMLLNEEDRNSIKRYLLFTKFGLKMDDPNEVSDYITKWNEYLKAYMDDIDGWNELAEIYLQCNNYNKAIYCLEELILHNPNDYRTMTRIGDIYASMGSTDSMKTALKYYSQSILTQETPRAFVGIAHCLNGILKVEKKLDDKMKSLVKISKAKIKEFYKDSPFKDFNIEMVYDI